MNPRIAAVSGPLKGSVFPIPETGFVIGRKHPENDAILENDEMVSRRHCRLERLDGRTLIRDLDSRNGTFVNGSSVLEKVLDPGDRLRVGSSTFIYVEHDEAEDSLPVFSEEEPDRTVTTFRLDREQTEAAGSDTAVLRAILGITTSINAIRDSDRLQERLLELIFEILPPKRAAILLSGHKADAFVSGTYRERGVPGNVKFPLIQAVTRQVLAEGVVALSNDRNPVLCAPLTVFDTKLGVVYLEGSETAGGFDQDHAQLLNAISGIAAVALEHARYVDWLQVENQRLKDDAGIEHGMIGESPKMAEVHHLIRRAAPSEARVVITGANGTGKELAARAIHDNSLRSNRPFIDLNCGAIPESLRESELFGHEKGSFTNALSQRKGWIEMADGGTLFLDEIAELSLSMQASLLRVLEQGSLYRVGGTRPISVDVRVIAATNRDLSDQVKDGRFREDLFHRLNVVSIRIPSLAERPEDIPLLASHFLKKFARVRVVSGFTPDALRLLLAYAWPGNVRELRNAVERAVVIGDSEYIHAEDLPESLLEENSEERPIRGLHDDVNDFKKVRVQSALRKADGRREQAANLLGISVVHLNRLIRSFGL